MKRFNSGPRARQPRARTRAWAPSPRSSEAGFSLIEATVALILVAVLFVGLSGVMGVAFRNLRQVRSQQQATALALEGFEFIRSLTWTELAMEPAATATDPLVLAGPPMMLDGSQVDLSQDEDLIDDAAGLVTPYTSVTLDNQVFNLSQYVTQAEDGTGTPETGLKRVVIVVDWQVGSASHQHFVTTLVSQSGVS